MPPAIAIILNGISRKKRKFYRDIYPPLAKAFGVTVFETTHAGHASTLADNAARQSFEIIVAAGGDGTLNQVINGILPGHPDVVIGLIPLGTGNDFARTCGLSASPDTLINLITARQPAPVDVGRVACHLENGDKAARYFINACSIGMGPAVVRRLARSHRSLGPTLTYWKAIFETFLTHRPQNITVRNASIQWTGKIRVVTVANGRSFGNALYIAPEAKTDDGMLDLFLAGDVPFLKFLWFQQALKAGKKINDPLIRYARLNRLTLSAPEPCLIETEGELAGFLPAEIEVVPSAIKFLR